MPANNTRRIGVPVAVVGETASPRDGRAWAGTERVKTMKSEKGVSLIETLVAMAILAIISLAFLSALATTSTARATNQERTSAKILAETIMENIRTDNFTPSYNATIPDEFASYNATINATSERNGNLQKIVITIQHNNRDVLVLETYKVDRSS
jgi:prepilin-type N-terminal cleavage/methylation domain-containing protein